MLSLSPAFSILLSLFSRFLFSSVWSFPYTKMLSCAFRAPFGPAKTFRMGTWKILGAEHMSRFSRLTSRDSESRTWWLVFSLQLIWPIRRLSWGQKNQRWLRLGQCCFVRPNLKSSRFYFFEGWKESRDGFYISHKRQFQWLYCPFLFDWARATLDQRNEAK